MKAFRRIWGIITTLAVIAVVVLAILLVGVRVVGLTPYAVLSGSMEPTYHVGSLIYVRKVAPEDVQIGDPITFVVNEDLLVATHRVVDIAVETTGTETVKDEETGEETTVEVPLDEPAYYYQTKGDANADVDGAPVYYKNLIGEPVFSGVSLQRVTDEEGHDPGRDRGAGAAAAPVHAGHTPLGRRIRQEERKEEGQEARMTLM